MNLSLKTDNCLKCEGNLSISDNVGSPFFRTAYDVGRELVITFKAPRQLGVCNPILKLLCESTGKITEYSLEWQTYSGLCDVYTATLCPSEKGLYFYRVEFDSAVGRAYTVRQGYYGACAFRPLCDNSQFEFQLTVSEFSYPAPKWLYGGIIYHIFVDRFCREGEVAVRDDVIINEDWDNGIPEYPAYPGAFLRNNMFFGGTLYGVISKLDYIASLGVNCIYLSPIFEAYSNHKYDTANYLKIDDMFGGEKAFYELLEKANRKGIKIILDGVFNHTGADSIYFNKYGKYDSLGAYQSKDSPYYDWFDFQSFPEKYTCWWDIDILPRINPSISSCGNYFIGEGGVIEHYARCGIGGMRLDVADELNDSFIAGIKNRLSEYSDETVLYGEVWEDASNKVAYSTRKKYFLGDELDGVMNYPLRQGIIQYFRYKDTQPLYYALCEVMANCPKRILDAQMNILGTHDTQRILTSLAAPDVDGRTNDELAVWRMSEEQYSAGIKMLKNAYLALATLPGITTIFYGDEAGMQGYSDPFNRMPFPWNNINCDLLEYYRSIGRLRRKESAYKDGEFKLLRLDSDVFAFLRVKGNNSLLTVINSSDKTLLLEFDGKASALLGNKAKKGVFAVDANSGGVVKLSSDCQRITFSF